MGTSSLIVVINLLNRYIMANGSTINKFWEDRLNYQVSLDYQTRYQLRNSILDMPDESEINDIKSKDDVKRLLLFKMENKQKMDKEAAKKRAHSFKRLTEQPPLKTGSADNVFNLRRNQESPMGFLNRQLKKAEADLLKPPVKRSAAIENSSAPVRRGAPFTNNQAIVAAAYSIKQKPQ